MIPCVEDVPAVCKIETFYDKQTQIPELLKQHPQGIAVRMSIPEKNIFHTIRLKKFDESTNEIIYDDDKKEDKIKLEDLIKIIKNYYFTCIKK
jgi:hypothetical protein